MDTGARLHELSVQGKWQEMMPLITEEMLEEFAIIGTYDEIAPKLKERWGSVCSTVFLALGAQNWQHENEIGDLVRALKG
jgi:hypothetical protein